MWYLNHLGIKKVRGLYFVDDERDKAVALRVHNACMNTLLQGMFLLILVVFVLKSPDWQLTVTTFGNIILGLLLLVMVASNCQYYYLWQKYDRG